MFKAEGEDESPGTSAAGEHAGSAGSSGQKSQGEELCRDSRTGTPAAGCLTGTLSTEEGRACSLPIFLSMKMVIMGLDVHFVTRQLYLQAIAQIVFFFSFEQCTPQMHF